MKYTGPDHSDHHNLTFALEQIQSVTTYINEMKKQAENSSKLLELSKAISGLPSVCFFICLNSIILIFNFE